jgi:predicted transcriptional regulator
MEIIFKLDKVVKELKITPNRLAVDCGLRSTTIYKLCKNEATRIHTDTLAIIMKTLNEISKKEGFNKEYRIEDIMEYKEK